MKALFSINSLSLLVCVATIVIWFSPWWLGGRNLAPADLQNNMMSPWRAGNETKFAKNHIVSDSVDQYLVYRMIAEKKLRTEGEIGWSSLTYGGTAQYANTMALYDDWTMQLHRWFSFRSAWHLGIALQVLIAMTGMFAFLRGRSITSTWAACGALAYAANSQFVTWIYHRWALGSFCWVPWMLWAVDRYRNGNRNCWSLVPVFTAMAFLGGTLQHAALVCLALAAVWLESAWRVGRNHRNQILLFRQFSTWAFLSLGIAAFMFIPCIDAFLISNRLGLHTGMHGNAENGIYPQGWLQPLLNLASYPLQIFPSILGRCDSVDLLKLFKSELFYIAYFGSLPVLLAFLAPWRRDAPLLAKILVIAGLLLPLTPLVRVLYQRLFLLFILGGILAFTHFMQTATRETRLMLCRISALIATAFTGIWLLGSLILIAQPGILSAVRGKIIASGGGSSFGHFSEWIAQRADRFTGDLFIWSPQQAIPLLLLFTALAGLRLTASTASPHRKIGSLIVAAAVVLEVSLFSSRWIVWTDPTTYPLFSSTPESEALKEHVGSSGRVTTLMHPTSHMAMTPFVPNTLAAYGVATIGGYDSIIPNGMLHPGTTETDAKRLGHMGVTHLVTFAGNPDVPNNWRSAWRSPSMELFENPYPQPRYGGFNSDSNMNEFIAGGIPQITALREKTQRENSRSIEVPAGISWIRVAENHAKGWEFRCGPTGEWKPVVRAPDSSMLMHLNQSAEPTTVHMRFQPPARRAGIIVTLCAVALTAIGAMISAFNRQPLLPRLQT